MTDNKGFSEEQCVRCGWTMGQPSLNCQNDDTPHVFPSQLSDATAPSDESTFVSWAREELRRAGLFDKDSDYGGMIGGEVMNLVETFSKAGHSGFSAALAANIFARLTAYKPLTPVTNDPSEWMHIAEDMAGIPNLWQSRRQPSLFSLDGGRSYYDLEEKQPRWRKLAGKLLKKHLPVFHQAEPVAR